MPDTTLHPAFQRKADAVVAQPVLTEYQALRQAGWMQAIDWVFIWTIAAVLVTLLFWRIFSAPTLLDVLACLIVVTTLFQVWLVLLVLRCAVFVLKLRAAMEMLPDEAARIVMAAYSGRR